MDERPPPAYIADSIQNAKNTFLGMSLFLYLLNREDTFQARRATLFPPGEQHHIRFAREGAQTPYEVLNYGPIIESMRGNAQFNLDYIRVILQSMVIQIGDMLARNRYFDQTPELEFYQHLRNALGHGNRYNLASGEPRRLARFQGREVTRELDGHHAFFSFMGPGDVLELWDWLEAYLRQLPP